MSNIIKFIIILFPLSMNHNLFAQTQEKIGVVVAAEFENSSNVIMFGIKTEDDARFVGKASASCNWIIKDQQIRITANPSTGSAIIDNGTNSCPFEIENVVKKPQQITINQAPTTINDMVISANGFKCSINNDKLVTCSGSFSLNPNDFLVEASGLSFVKLSAYIPPYLYSYDSYTGCLCKYSYDNKTLLGSQDCTSPNGKTKKFAFSTDPKKVEWCKNN